MEFFKYCLMIFCAIVLGCNSPTKSEQSSSTPQEVASVDPLKALQDKANRGDADAMYALAGVYLNGEDTPQDDALALKWTQKAAKAGNIDARFEIATLSFENSAAAGIDQNTAKQWLEEAAEHYVGLTNRGDAKAMERLAWMYGTGYGMPKNEERAEIWQTEATKKKLEAGIAVDPTELYNLGVAYYQGELVDKDDVTAAQIFQTTAEAGLDQAQYSLALFFASGTVVEQNDMAAFQWFLKAAEQGHAQAQFEVAQRYYYGYVIPKDLELASKWFEKSASQGNTKSQLLLGMMYGKGEIDGEINYKKAAYWLEKAKDSNEFPIGKAFLGLMYMRGDGVDKNEELGLQLLKDAAALGDETAIRVLSGAFSNKN